jgi:hypothetical protein
MVGMKALAVAILLAAQATAVFAVTGLKYISTSGDYIGQGITQTLKASSGATVTVSGTAGSASVSVTDPGNWWYLDFAAPGGSPLAPGSYPDAARYPFNSPMSPGLSMSGNGRGCNTLKGWFRVLEYQVDGSGTVSKLAIDFVQNCEVTGPPLYGSIRYKSDYPMSVPDTVAVAGADFAAFSGDAATLDGTQSFSRKHSPLSYLWTQLDGPAVTLSSSTGVSPAFTAPAVPPGGASLHFRLDVTDKVGVTASDDVVVVVQGADTPRTQVRFHGDSSDYITGGRSYSFDLYNAAITFSRNFAGGVSVSISGDTWWTFDAATPAGTTFQRGAYKNAQRYPFQEAGRPGLSLSGDGRGCNSLTGRFTVHKVKFDGNGNPKVADISFEQRCEGGKPAAYGEVVLNAVPHQQLAQQLRAARQRYAAQLK